MRTLITILSLSVFTSIYAQKDKSVSIQWHDKGTDNLKLLSTDMTYSDKGKFYYYLSNDNENFYVDLRVLDKEVQRQISFSGLSVWINMENKKTKGTGFIYPARKENEGHPGIRNQAAPGNMQGMQIPQNAAPGGGFPGGRNMQMPVSSNIELIGFSESGPTYISSDEPGNIKGTLIFENSGYMVYELAIPLSKMPERPKKSKGNDESFAIGISYEGIPSAPMMAGGSGGGAPAGRFRTPGPRGGVPSSGIPESNFTPVVVSPLIIWFKDMSFATQK